MRLLFMNSQAYVSEVLRQLDNKTYYTKLDSDPSASIRQNISDSLNEMGCENSHVTNEFDSFPSNIRTPNFYVLPKIHKEPDCSLPLQYPGRPIVSACNASTVNISQYVDYVLKPSMQTLPSYVKDTTDFINKIKHTKFKSKDSYLVTLDVASLYTNIPHQDGIDAATHFLHNQSNPGHLSSNEISKLIALVLENNHFKFDNDHYLQKMGTAMGSAMAPAYASLFMGKLEQDFLDACVIKPTIWLRFLDDIFMIWDGSLNELNTFICDLNKCHPTIKFTHQISQNSVSFLDVRVAKDDSLNVVTDVFVKETNTHQYLNYTSCHPKACKNGIPYSQAKRYRRIISADDKFNACLPVLREYFLERKYPISVIDDAFQKVATMSQEDALQPITRDENVVIPFTVYYNPSLPNIGSSIHKYWDLLNLSSNYGVRHIHNHFKPMVAYKRPKNLQDYLVSSIYRKDDDSVSSSSMCNRRRCSHCQHITIGSSFTSHITDKTYNMRHDTNCSTKDVIYMITCKKCSKQYVGQTSQPVSKRMNSHRFDINNCMDPAFSTHVATHFNMDQHSMADFSFVPIDCVTNGLDRLCKETYWIHKLKTLYPDGLNSKLLFTCNSN